MAKTWSDFIPDIIMNVSSPKPNSEFVRAPDSVIIHSLKRAAEDLLCESHLFRKTEPMYLQCGVDDYPIMGCDEPAKVHKVWIKLDECSEYCELEDGWSYQDNCVYIECNPIQEGGVRDGIMVEYSYAPDLTGCDVPEVLCDKKYRRALTDITLYYLHGMINQDWGNGNLMLFYETRKEYWFGKARKLARDRGPSENRRSISEKANNAFWGNANRPLNHWRR